MHSGEPDPIFPAPRRPRKGPEKLARKWVQRRLVADEPKVPERIVESALSMGPPRLLMVLRSIETAVGACRDRALNERVGIVDEDLDSHCRSGCSHGVFHPLFAGSVSRTGDVYRLRLGRILAAPAGLAGR